MRIKKNIQELKIAIVHEWLVNFRGSEKVLLELTRIFPQAVVFASVVDKSQLPEELACKEIRSTFIQKLPNAIKWYQKYLFLMPFAYESLDLSEFDLVISSSHSCAKGVYPAKGAMHISYCYTPMRYAWSGFEEYRKSLNSKISRMIMTMLMYWIREWDLAVNDRVDHFIAISHEVQRRIEKYYKRESTVIFPGVDDQNHVIEKKVSDIVLGWDDQPYYLILGRVVPYKRVDLALKACNRLNINLIVAGTGSELNHLKKIAGPNITFVETFSDEDAHTLYSHCEAFLFPGEEDFGLTVIEAQLHGKPVIAYGRGGVEDTVIQGETGVFFYEQNEQSLIEAVQIHQTIDYDTKYIKSHALKFSNEHFKSSIMEFIQSKLIL